MDTEWFRFFLAVFASWRVGQFLARDNGPWNIFRKLRRSGPKAMSCFYCMSVWAAAPLALFVMGLHWADSAVCWLAVAGGAALLDRTTSPPFTFEMGAEDELLRSERRDSEHRHA